MGRACYASGMSQPPDEFAVFVRDGEAFLPTAHASSPWGADRLHGGPTLGLLTRAVESELDADGWLPTRLTFDMFRPVPRAPLHVDTELLRSSGRLRLVSARLRSGPAEVARVTALGLRSGGHHKSGRRFVDAPHMAGPSGFETRPLLRGVRRSSLPPGFHTSVETRWLPQRVDGPLAIWFRIPMPLVAGEATSSLQCAAALADFCNALVSFAAPAGEHPSPPYINTDTTLYLERKPRGEWIGLLEGRSQEHDGISLTETALCDEHGCFGRAQQARLANAPVVTPST